MSNSIAAKELGKRKNKDVIQEFVSTQGKDLLDVGCGDLTFTKILLELGGNITAIDPDPMQAEWNREHPVPGIDFHETGGDAIPLEENSIDGVFFSYSLHHVPQALQPQVFDETLRVLRPDGYLFVLEPMDCPVNQIMRLFHDEDRERDFAWQSVQSLATRFETAETYQYYDEVIYESWEAFATRFASRTFNLDYSPEDVWRDEVRIEFEKQGGAGHIFTSPKRLMILKRPLA